MPYTLSHLGAVVPFRRLRWLRLDAAMIGACAPDFGYFIHWPLSVSVFSHSLWGSLAVGFPITIFILCIYRAIQSEVMWLFRLNEVRTHTALKAQEVGWVPLSIILGIWSHVFIDGFTHIDGWATEFFPSLWIFVHGLPLYKWLQYGLSVIGAIVVFQFYQSQPKIQKDKTRAHAWIFISSVSVAAAFIYALMNHSVKSVRVLGVYSVVVFTQGLFLGIIGVSLKRLKRKG